MLGLDFKQTVGEIHPSLGEPEGSKNISNDTIEQLGTAIQRLQEVKIQRMQQVCHVLLGFCFFRIIFFSVRESLLTAQCYLVTRSCIFITGALELDGHTN